MHKYHFLIISEMSTRHRIDNAISSIPMGDVEKYFSEVSNIIESNSGVHDNKVISHDCNNTAAPVHAGQFTRFKLTDHAMDIVDLSKGYITMKLEVDVQFLFKDLEPTYTEDHKLVRAIYFIGFKSGSHIIDIYNVYSNGVLTNCKQTKARHEQFITYSSKAKEERVGRPGMYSTHKAVQNMSDCVCGAYIELPLYADKDKKQTITFDVVIQVDDLLPFSAMEYYPRFLTGELELELAPSLTQNMVFCPVSISKVLESKDLSSITENDLAKYSLAACNSKIIESKQDYRFTQCGDYTDCPTSYNYPDTTDEFQSKLPSHTEKLTIIPSNLVIREAKSYIHGFNIKDTVKQNLANMFGGKNLVIPAQWVDHYTFSQLPTANSIRTNIQLSMFNATQLIITFPATPNQLVVSRNPHLEAIQCQVADRIVPDKFFGTLDRAHAEMIIESLNMDTLFTAPDELIEALTKDRGSANEWTLRKKDDGDYMLVINLERYGNGCFCDGLSGQNVPINFQANFIKGTQNPHYYTYEDNKYNLHQHNLNLFIVSDAFWVCNKDGCQLVKDVATDY